MACVASFREDVCPSPALLGGFPFAAPCARRRGARLEGEAAAPVETEAPAFHLSRRSMLPSSRTLLVSAVIAIAATASGCAARSAAPIPQGDISVEEAPEPPTPGITPLTQEQEEMIPQ